jgi:hypothetical protein
MVTHDVEGPVGEDFCRPLLDLNETFGLKAAFQLVPESGRGRRSKLIDTIRSRGSEVNLHDLNHDGYLFRDREEFLIRAARLRRYAEEYGCSGFRSAVMYRRQEWHSDLGVAYDMSVPNVAHLEPQRGGCCTVMPYFVGDVLELPLTTVQDYTLLHILGDYSTALWNEQIHRILELNGLITILTHPDYLVEPRALKVYRELLGDLSRLRDGAGVWTALPADVNHWWRCRSQMRLVEDGRSWRIVGPESHRARLAFASLDDGRLALELADSDMAVPA